MPIEKLVDIVCFISTLGLAAVLLCIAAEVYFPSVNILHLRDRN